jgi:hypothetical protein
LAHADDLIQSIWGWLVFGVVVSAAITTFIPTEGLSTVGDWDPIVTMMLMLVISLPLYVCATASVPIAASLVAGGMPTGAALVFLMAGPATNVATIGTIQRTFGARILGIYLGTIVAGSIGLGIVFDAFVPTSIATAAAHGEHTGWWAVVSAGVLLVLLGRYAARDMMRWVSQRRVALAKPSETRLVMGVDGMTCGGCVGRLERELNAAEGIEFASVSLEPGQAIVEGVVDRVHLATLIEAAGFKAVV